jgi:hypothetical protein
VDDLDFAGGQVGHVAAGVVEEDGQLVDSDIVEPSDLVDEGAPGVAAEFTV